MSEWTVRKSNLQAANSRIVNLTFTALLFCACVPPRSPVTSAFVHPSLNIRALAREQVVVYGYRGLDGTLEQRQDYDEQLRAALHRAVPSLNSVPPAKFKEWLVLSKNAVALGSALDEGPEALPYDELTPVGEESRYFMWATVSHADQRRWQDDDDDHIDYCVGWQLHVRYAIADLRLRQLVTEVQVELDDEDCRRNSRSNSAEDAPTFGAAIVRSLFDVAVDTAVDGAFGTYPDLPPLAVQLEASATQFFQVLRNRGHAQRPRPRP